MSDVKLVTFDHPDDPMFNQNRPLELHRPCECGCDQRGDPNLVGYLNAIKDGVGFSLRLYDEADYSTLKEVLS